jgi:HAD superfamily hydrolase (TIGR01459 family)
MRHLGAMNSHRSRTAAGAIPLVSSISPLSTATDAWLVDIWGVMHNGVVPFLDAARACVTFRRIGGTVLLLSNAPRPAASVAEQLQRIGVPENAYDTILTSGDAARAMIAEYAGRPVYHLGPERDIPLFDGLDVTLATLEDAHAVICTGLFDDEIETPEDYRRILEAARKRELPMVCANPDLKVERGGKVVWCAGGIAQLFEALGGRVDYAGKPFAPIYRLAFDEFARLRGSNVAPERVLAIGDGIKTDVAGAGAAGVRSVFIASGVHVDGLLDSDTLERVFEGAPARPIAAMTALVW